MTTQVWLNPLASLSHGEVMLDYVLNDCCPNFIRASYMNATQGPLYLQPIALFLQKQHTSPHWWQGGNVHCRTDFTFLLYIEALHFDFLQYLHLMWKNDCNKYFCVRIFAILYTVEQM